MEFVIVTGLSGSGKTRAMQALEDIGFFCVDNLPPALLPTFYELCLQSEGRRNKVAVASDSRSGHFFDAIYSSLEALKSEERIYQILFLDCSDSVLVNRFQETRRKHPLAEANDGSVKRAVDQEREMLKSLKECADYVINTSGVSPAQLKGRISKIFLNKPQDSLDVHCVSFGFKYGMPMEADLVFDVRFIENPYYIDALRPLTGLDKPVYDFVMEKEEAKGFKKHFTDMIDFLVPQYSREGKSQLVIAVGCTGGHHRSVAFAQYMYEHLKEKSIRASVTHRDMLKN